MSARIIDGHAIAISLRGTLRTRVSALVKKHRMPPGLAVILVGDNPASALYVRNKIKACEEVGIRSTCHRLPASALTEDLLKMIAKLNEDETVHGILLQLPLAPQIDICQVMEAISVDKDADGFHPYNVGSIVVGHATFPPCTPNGVVKLLESEGIDVEGKNVVVVGASNIVGKPMSLMLMAMGATVSVCHAKTHDLSEYTQIADILIVAAGSPNLITPSMVKAGAVVIDVGINRLPDGRLAGDVDFDGVRQKASYITPVPGGVGPMTVSMLLENTVVSAERALATNKSSSFIQRQPLEQRGL